jgi:hypothetical protein
MQGLCLHTTVIDSDGVKQDTNDFIKNQNLRNSIYGYETFKKPEIEKYNTQSNSYEETLEKQEIFNEQIFENYSEQSELNSNVEEQKESDDSNYED